MSDDIIAILIREQVRIVTSAIHATQIFQMLDVMLFSALGKHATCLETLDEESRVTAFLLTVHRDFHHTMVEVTIWEAFTAIGFTQNIDPIPYGLLFTEEKFR
jgi:hypothetical protein